MHRSGTSLTTGWLHRCGLPIDNGRVEGADHGNPKGHFEDQDFLELHKRTILQALPESRGWIVTRPDEVSRLRLDEDQMRPLAEARIARYPAWGWKDPRTTLFLNQWKQVIPGMKLLWVWRPCHEVVHSLVKRYLVSPAKRQPYLHVTIRQAIDMWKLACRCGVDFIQAHPEDCLSVRLDVLLKNDAALIHTLNRRMGLKLNTISVGSDFEPKLLNRTLPKWNLALRLGPRVAPFWPGVRSLEQQMAELSWNPATDSVPSPLSTDQVLT
jgi:hypothetical protein